MFPLLQLPEAASKIVLLNLAMIHQLFLSIYHEQFKTQLKSLNLGRCRIKITIKEMFIIDLKNFKNETIGILFHTEDPARIDGDPKRIFQDVETVAVLYVNEDSRDVLDHVSTKDALGWIRYLMGLFKIHQIKHLSYQTDDYCHDAIKKNLKGLRIKKVELIGAETMRNFEKIALTLPSVARLRIKDRQEEVRNIENLQKILIQNFEYLNIPATFNFNFSDSLVVNSSLFQIKSTTITMKHMNRFLKLWINGGNLRLRKLTVQSTHSGQNEADKNVLLNGISFQKLEIERRFECLDRRVDVIEGGYDIISKEGRKATFEIIFYPNEFRFQLFVWEE